MSSTTTAPTIHPSIQRAIRGLRDRYNWIAAMRGHISTAQVNAAVFENPAAVDRGIFIGSQWNERMKEVNAITTTCLDEIDDEIVAIRQAIAALGGNPDE